VRAHASTERAVGAQKAQCRHAVDAVSRCLGRRGTAARLGPKGLSVRTPRGGWRRQQRLAVDRCEHGRRAAAQKTPRTLVCAPGAAP
jgi:hypothetical protein